MRLQLSNVMLISFPADKRIYTNNVYIYLHMYLYISMVPKDKRQIPNV